MKITRNRVISILLAIITLISAFASTACKDSASLDDLSKVAYYGSLEHLRESAKFDFYIPTELPGGYLQTKAWTYENNHVYITYTNGERELVFAAVKGAPANDLSETLFNQITEHDIGGISVRLLERFSSPICVNLSKFTINKINYALDSVTPEEAEIMIASLKPISQISDFTSSLGANPIKYNSLSELSSAFGMEVPFPEIENGITAVSSYELIGGAIAQIKFNYNGEEYTFAMSKNSAAKDFYVFKSENKSYANDVMTNDELFVEIFGVQGEDEDSPGIIHMTAWSNNKASYIIHSSKGATEATMLDLSIIFFALTPNSEEADYILPIIEE